MRNLRNFNSLKSRNQSPAIQTQIQSEIPFSPQILWSTRRMRSFAEINETYELLNLLEDDLSASYRNIPGIIHMVNALANTQRRALIQKISRTEHIGIGLDESKDISGKEQLILTVKYYDVETGLTNEEFLCVWPLTAFDANSVFKCAIDILEKLDITDKVVSICTDGAPVMASRKNGVAGLSLKHPYIITTHCVAHQLNLCTKDLESINTKFQSISGILYETHSVLHNGATRQVKLYEMEEDVFKNKRNLIQPIANVGFL